ncbi:hypothetical protein JJQ72_06195 [Paenibacillus sp. F411]|uniref:hypothetical protein n=1 Tax=Paenibacillus sp. F411 TaxID=2820239 RepID=UPI001AAFB6A4|nr:hypothetical protein [Paenibacillus sp. F411]MBO2943567.1 hypothetical protein [Paenibacillus sp. F411]
MATHRVNKSGKRAPPFTRIVNSSLQDARLSFKARGLLAYMLTKPDHFRFYLDELTKHTTEGKDSIRAALKELESFGYIKRYVIKDSRGKIMSWEIDIYEHPESGFPVVENPTLVTNDKVPTNDKRLNKYIAFTNDDHSFIKTYLKYFQQKKNKQHMRITEEQHQMIYGQIEEIQSAGITHEEWEAEVRDHFETLPKSNNGNIIAFLHAAPRRFDVDLCR